MTMDIKGAVLADGLSKDDASTLDALIDLNASLAARNARRVRYYEGDVRPPAIGISVLPENVRVEEHCDWPRKAVTSVSERSRLSGFVFEDGQSDDALDAIVRDNGLVAAYNRHVHSELIHGCMFATVGLFGGRAYVRFHTAESSAAIWDDARGRIGAGMVVAERSPTRWSPREPVPTRVNLHLPGRIVTIERTDIAKWVAQDVPTPLERPAMEAFAFRPTALKPFGQSRIDRTVMSIADDVMRTLQNMAVSSALYSSPQKYILGLTDDQFDALSENRVLAYLTHLLLATQDEDGNSPTVGQLSPSSPEPYISILRTYATLFSASTGVPVSSLGIVQDNPSSAQAIDTAREDICICAQDLNESNGDSLRNVALMAMAYASGTSEDDLDDNQKTVMAKFLDPSMPSVVSQADAAVKVASAAPWFAESDEFLRMLGFGEPTIRQLTAARARAAAQSRLAKALEATYSKAVGEGDGE